MSTGLDWYKREPLAYLADTQGLTSREHAVYAVVIELLYIHGGEINNDPKWIGGWISDMGTAAIRNTLASLQQRDKITLVITEGKISQKRAKNEAKTKEKLRENAVKNGKKGGEKSAYLRSEARKNNDLDEPPASSEVQADKRREEKREKERPIGLSKKKDSPQGEITPSEPDPPKPPPKEPPGFDEFWSAVPRKVSKGAAKKAFSKALKIADATTIIAGMRAYAKARLGEDEQFTAHPATWLTAERWTDEPPTKPRLRTINGSKHDTPRSDPTMDAIAIAARMRRSPGAHRN